MSYSDAELLHLMTDLESELSERKESWAGDAPEKGRQAVCAFANDLPDHRAPGVLFVGVRDDGTPTGLPITDELLLTLAAIKTDGNIVPPPTISVEKRTLGGVEVAVVTVRPADAPPVRYRGRIWIRVGPRRAIATAQDERILNEKRRFKDAPFEVHPVPACPLDALDRVLFEREYLPAAVAPDVLEANNRTYEQRLASCGMIVSAEDPIPTVLGILVVGKLPREWIPAAYLQFLRIQGTRLSDPIMDESMIDGPVGRMIRRLDEKLEAHNRVGVDIVSGPKEIRTSTYPIPALQQLTRNAVMHRTYEGTNAPVRVTWFDDRIEISSPGGPFGAVSIENFGREGFSDYRNSRLAGALRDLGYVQRFGVGIALARRALAENGNPELEFRVEPNWVTAVVRPR